MTTILDPAVYTAAEVAALLGCSQRHVYEQVKLDGNLCGIPPIRIGKRVTFSKIQVQRFLSTGSAFEAAS